MLYRCCVSFFLRAFDKGFKNIACTILMFSEILECMMDCFAFLARQSNRRVTSGLISIL